MRAIKAKIFEKSSICEIKMLLVFVPYLTARVHYTMNLLLGQLLGIKIELTTDKERYIVYKGPKFNYSNQLIEENELWIEAADLLFEHKINPVETHRVEVNEMVTSVVSTQNGIPDVIASAFYLVSRYEEYQTAILDLHKRYIPEQSIAYRYGFLQKAMVNRYAHYILKRLTDRYPNLEFKKPSFEYEITMDIDHPFYYTNMVFWKRIPRLFKSMIELKNKKNIYNTYHVFSKVPKGRSTFFVLCQDAPSERDNYNKREGKIFKNLIHTLAEKHDIGLHASYLSQQKEKIGEEKIWLEAVIGKQITKNRFHFLRMTYPNSLQIIEKQGIKRDYTMGYSEEYGFRSSIANPYSFFDIENNRTTELTIVPFCIMDSTFEYHQRNKDAINNAYKAIRSCIDECQAFGGHFVPIFHNDILKSDSWQQLFNQMMQWLEG